MSEDGKNGNVDPLIIETAVLVANTIVQQDLTKESGDNVFAVLVQLSAEAIEAGVPGEVMTVLKKKYSNIKDIEFRNEQGQQKVIVEFI
ncbi:MAG: hypothetical protein V1838_01865 [Patescibacteria group bacterium]